MFELDNSGRLMKLLFSYHAFVSLLCLPTQHITFIAVYSY